MQESTLQIFSACVSDKLPPNTVKSWLNTNVNLPLIVPWPVTTPSPGIYTKILIVNRTFCLSNPNSPHLCSTNISYSLKEPGSNKRSTLSLAVSLPFWCCLSILSCPPPRTAASLFPSITFVKACAVSRHKIQPFQRKNFVWFAKLL